MASSADEDGDFHSLETVGEDKAKVAREDGLDGVDAESGGQSFLQ